MYLYVLCRHMLLLFIFTLGACAPIAAMDKDNNTNAVLLFGRDVAVGTVAAGVECTVSHPLTTIKYRLQLGDKLQQINFNPRFLYTGFGLNIASMAPTTALQFGINGVFNNMLPEHPTKPMASAFGAGVCSAVASSPIELLVLHLLNEERRRIAAGSITQKLGAGQVLQALVTYGNGHRILMRGMQSKALRDGGFSAGLLWGNQEIKDYLQRAAVDGVAASLGATTVTGFGVVIITHPFDTISTVMQESCNVTSDGPRKEQITTMRQAAHIIYQQQKLRGFYKGAVPCYGFVTLAIGIMDNVKNSLTEYTDRLMK